MNLFFQKLNGKLWSTNKMEQYIAQMEADIARYRQVEKSAELTEYNGLKEVVKSKKFQQEKHNLQTTKYKTTKYYLTLQELRSLEKDKILQLYLQVCDSQILKEYIDFRNSENYIKLSDKKIVRTSPDLKRMANFESSKQYKAWLQLKDSKMPERYKNLKKEVATSEFQQQNAFWSNSKRWLTTEQYQQELRLAQLSKMPDIVFYLSQDSKKIEAMEKWRCTFNDEMQWTRLSDSPWKAGFAYKNKSLKSQHSFTNEQQANNGGKNTGSVNGTLTIITRREAVTAPAWDTKKGFVNKDFEYTSDVIQTADSFRQKEGLFMIKVRAIGNIHHAAWLGNESRLPIVNLFHFNGKKIVMGLLSEKGFDGTSLRGISEGKYYIYSLRWTEREMIFYVNNLEVYRSSYQLPKGELFLAFSSFISDKQRAEEGKFEIDWVRVYK